MEIDDDRREDAIEKANKRGDNVHSHYERFFSDWEELYLHEETMGRYELEKVLWRGAFKVVK